MCSGVPCDKCLLTGTREPVLSGTVNTPEIKRKALATFRFRPPDPRLPVSSVKTEAVVGVSGSLHWPPAPEQPLRCGAGCLSGHLHHNNNCDVASVVSVATCTTTTIAMWCRLSQWPPAPQQQLRCGVGCLSGHLHHNNCDVASVVLVTTCLRMSITIRVGCLHWPTAV